ncbi:hypothetical protein [Mycolicibacterium sp. XJ870]
MADLDPADEHDDADPRLAPLLAWRQQLVDSGAVAPRSFKESHLRLVLRSGRTDVEQIRAMLPGSVGQHADEMARILAELATTSAEQTAARGKHRSPDASSPGLPVPTHPDPPAPADPAPPAPPPEPPEPESAQPTPPAPERNETPETPETTSGFAPYLFGSQQAALHVIKVRRGGAAGTTDLSWPAYETPGVALYRLVSVDGQAPYSPDRADLVAVTEQPAATDERPPIAPVRHYQVWVNAGASRAEAQASQPLLYASGVVVRPITDFEIREDAGWVIGQWTAPPGIGAVQVYRIPIDEVDRDEAQYRILAGSENLAGFVDTEPVRGQRYRYRARCAVDVEGVVGLAEPAEADVELAAALAPVTDLAVETDVDGDTCELSWTPPAGGQVVIYCSQNGPSAGAEGIELPEGALEQVGLTPELRLAQPVSEQPGPDRRRRSLMSGVSWPSQWSRAYFTPVTILAERAILGRTQSSVRTGTIRDIELAEYCNKQILTFDWPDGAAGVVVYLAPKGHDPRAGLTGRSFEISLEEYERYGGMHLTGQLPVGGCSLHLAPVAYAGGRRMTGTFSSVEYPGLLRLQYAVRIGRDPNGFPTTATVALRAEHDVPGSPGFVLVNNPQRLPLSVHDGQPVDVAPLDANGQLADHPSKELRWSALTTSGDGELWAANVSGLQGWIRLFVDIPSPAQLRVVALLDPPVDTLQLTAVAP